MNLSALQRFEIRPESQYLKYHAVKTLKHEQKITRSNQRELTVLSQSINSDGSADDGYDDPASGVRVYPSISPKASPVSSFVVPK